MRWWEFFGSMASRSATDERSSELPESEADDEGATKATDLMANFTRRVRLRLTTYK